MASATGPLAWPSPPPRGAAAAASGRNAATGPGSASAAAPCVIDLLGLCNAMGLIGTGVNPPLRARMHVLRWVEAE
eukprot:13229921-Alexandrium_andersonii.AAC.1